MIPKLSIKKIVVKPNKDTSLLDSMKITSWQYSTSIDSYACRINPLNVDIWHFLSQWIFKILSSFRVYKNLTSSSRKFCWSTENKTARMKFRSWHRRFGHLSILTLFKRKTSLKQLVIDWQFFSFDHRTLEWQAGRGGGRGQDATSQMYPFLSKRKKPVSTSRSLTTKYHKHLLQTLEGRVI